MNGRWKWLLLALALLASLGAAPQPQQDTVTYERYDVYIDIQADGSLLVAEVYQIRFEGKFRTGFAEIPLAHIDEITDVQVWEDDQPYTYRGSGPGTFIIDSDRDAIFVEWEYEPTSGAEVRTFTVRYRAIGALKIYPDQDSISWIAVPADRGGIPVEASHVSVHCHNPCPPPTWNSSPTGQRPT